MEGWREEDERMGELPGKLDQLASRGLPARSHDPHRSGNFHYRPVDLVLCVVLFFNRVPVGRSNISRFS